MLTADQTALAEQHIASIIPQDVERYTRYMSEVIAPKSREDEFRRFLFAFASVHTNWKSNCRMYLALQELGWLHDKEQLKARIIESGAGMYNNRTEFIHEFSEFFWDHPGWFNKSKYETWIEYRDRMERRVTGLGFAKTAFTIELTHPVDCQVLCTDVHVLKMYGFNAGKVKRRELYEIEKHWTDACAGRVIPSAIARWLFWDKKQGRSDSRYWTFLFEKENYNERLAKVASIEK